MRFVEDYLVYKCRKPVNIQTYYMDFLVGNIFAAVFGAYLNAGDDLYARFFSCQNSFTDTCYGIMVGKSKSLKPRLLCRSHQFRGGEGSVGGGRMYMQIG